MFGYRKLDRIEKDARYRRLDNVGWDWNSFCFMDLQKEKVAPSNLRVTSLEQILDAQ